MATTNQKPQSRRLTSEEQEKLVYYSEVHSESNGSGRWTEYVDSVVRHDDGSFYRISWQRGLTENQEDEFYDGEVPVVFPQRNTSVKSEVVYLTADEISSKEQAPGLASRLREELPSFEIATGLDPKTLIDGEAIATAASSFLEASVELDGLKAIPLFAAHLEATRDFLEALLELQKNPAVAPTDSSPADSPAEADESDDYLEGL